MYHGSKFVTFYITGLYVIASSEVLHLFQSQNHMLSVSLVVWVLFFRL